MARSVPLRAREPACTFRVIATMDPRGLWIGPRPTRRLRERGVFPRSGSRSSRRRSPRQFGAGCERQPVVRPTPILSSSSTVRCCETGRGGFVVTRPRARGSTLVQVLVRAAAELLPRGLAPNKLFGSPRWTDRRLDCHTPVASQPATSPTCSRRRRPPGSGDSGLSESSSNPALRAAARDALERHPVVVGSRPSTSHTGGGGTFFGLANSRSPRARRRAQVELVGIHSRKPTPPASMSSSRDGRRPIRIPHDAISLKYGRRWCSRPSSRS